MTVSQNTEGKPSHSLLLIPELDSMLGRAKEPHAIAIICTDHGVLHPDTGPLQTGTLPGPDQRFLMFCTCKQDGHLMELLGSRRDRNLVQCETQTLDTAYF